MFIIAGISPKIKILDNNPRLCPTCGLAQAYLKRTDNYLSLFFIPLFRVKKGEPFIICDRCENISSNANRPLNLWQEQKAPVCTTCGRAVDKNFQYCPFCGKRI